MKAVKPPRNVLEAVQRNEEDRHARRLAEIKKMQVQLRLLSTFAPALRDYRIDINWWAQSLVWDRSNSCISFSNADSFNTNTRLREVLIKIGFKEVKRSDDSMFKNVLLRNGRLKLSFTIWERTQNKTESTTETKKETQNAIPATSPV
jgi:hypothetical protein